MRVISYYTNEKYRLQAEEMAVTARAVGLKVKLYERPPASSWWVGCNYKCGVVLEALQEFGRESVLFLDADTRVRKYPSILNNLDADFAAFFIHPTVPSGGCTWWNGHRALRYAEAWVRVVQENPQREDDSMNFTEALNSVRPSSIYRLPPGYNWNEATMRTSFPGADPVIDHLFVGSHDYPVNRPKKETVNGGR